MLIMLHTIFCVLKCIMPISIYMNKIGTYIKDKWVYHDTITNKKYDTYKIWKHVRYSYTYRTNVDRLYDKFVGVECVIINEDLTPLLLRETTHEIIDGIDQLIMAKHRGSIYVSFKRVSEDILAKCEI